MFTGAFSTKVCFKLHMYLLNKHHVSLIIYVYWTHLNSSKTYLNKKGNNALFFTQHRDNNFKRITMKKISKKVFAICIYSEAYYVVINLQLLFPI